jgi:flagellar assembly protein FliH
MSDSERRGKADSFEPKKISGSKVEIKAFRPRTLGEGQDVDYHAVKQKFGSLSGLDEDSKNPAFNLHPASKRSLGVEKQEKGRVEELVQAEVEERLEKLRRAAYSEGFEAGRAEGAAKAEGEHREALRPMLERFTRLLQEFDDIKKELYHANESFLIQLVFQISKQVILKDLAIDRDYVKRITASIVEKLGAKDNIRIKVSKVDAENIETIKEHLKAQIPDLRNLQIEGSDELQAGGCKVETDLSRINASVENQLAAIEKSLGET